MKFVKKYKITKKRYWVCLKINWIEKLSEPNWTCSFIKDTSDPVW